MRLQRALVLVLAAIISVLTIFIVAGRQFARGPVLMTVSSDHGVHLNDLPIIGMWVIGLGVCTVLWARPPSGE